MVFTSLIVANIFLTLVNRSFFYSIVSTLKYKNNLVMLMVGLTIVIVGLLLFVGPFRIFFQFEQLTFLQLITSIVTGFVFVIWFEVVKWMWRRKN